MLQSMVYLPLRKMKVEDIFDAELPCFPRLLIQLTPVCLVVSVCVCAPSWHKGSTAFST